MGRVWRALSGLVAVLTIGSASAHASPFSYLSKATDQLGMPGYVAGTLITPEGSLYTGWVELGFRFGPSLRPTSVTVRDLLDGRSPVVRYHMSAGGVSYTVTVFCWTVGHRPVNFVRVVMRNLSRRPAVGAWGAGLRYSGGARLRDGHHAFRFVRPLQPSHEGDFTQPGSIFNPDSAWAFSGDAVIRDGQVLLVFPRSPRGVTRRLTLEPDKARGPVSEGTEFGDVDYQAHLVPGARRQLGFAMPVVPVAPASPDYPAIAHSRFDVELTRCLQYWRALFARAIHIEVPERKVDDAFYTSLANMAMSRYPSAASGWVQTVNKLQYNAFWLRDASMIANSFDLAGLHQLAGQDLDFFPVWQRDDGLFISRPNQYDGFGEALWAIGRHAAATHDRSFAERMLAAVERAVGWFEHERETDPLGLMPLSAPGDNELTTGHITGDNFLAADGIRESIAMANLVGRTDLAQRWAQDLSSYMTDLRAQLARAEAKTGGWIPPAIEANGGQDWGNLWASYPEQVLPATDAAVTATLRHVLSRFREGIATYNGGRELHAYLGFRVFETELLRDQQRAVVNGLYAELAHTTGTNGGFEVGVGRGGPRELREDLAPHGWFAAEYVALLRNMLVREDGHAVVLMGAVSPTWLRPGRRIAVSAADTKRGRVAFTLQTVAGGAVLTWRGTLAGGTKLHWPIPAAARDVRAPGVRRNTRTITLPGVAGRLRVRWHLVGPFPSFSSTVRTVMAEWRAGI